MPTITEMVSAAKDRIENLTAEELISELERGDVLLVDVREPAERLESGFIQGAVEVPRGMLEFCACPTSPYYRNEFGQCRRIILHCASGGRSALAAVALQELGYQNVAHVDGGINACKEAGLHVMMGA